MEDIEITKEFLDENAEEVKTWEEASLVYFSAWVDSELVDKALKRLKSRAKRWQKTHPETYIQDEPVEKLWNGEVSVAISVCKDTPIEF
jgi:hypothetical protein